MNFNISFKTVAAVASAMLLVFAVCSFAQQDNPPGNEGSAPGAGQAMQGMGQHFIQKFDKNNDGKVSKEEFTGPADRFTRLDKNGDGFISADEMPQMPPPQKQGQQN